MSTHPITPGTKVPFPCWLKLRATGWQYYHGACGEAHAQSFAQDRATHYSTLPESQCPEDVPTELSPEEMHRITVAVGHALNKRPELYSTPVAPHPTLAQLVEGAARDIDALADAWDNHAEPYSQSDVRHAILRHLSPEWERMVRERDDVSFAYDRLLAIHGTVLDDIATLRTENERLTRERDSFYMDYRIKCDSETKVLRTRLRELEEDKARQKP